MPMMRKELFSFLYLLVFHDALMEASFLTQLLERSPIEFPLKFNREWAGTGMGTGTGKGLQFRKKSIERGSKENYLSQRFVI